MSTPTNNNRGSAYAPNVPPSGASSSEDDCGWMDGLLSSVGGSQNSFKTFGASRSSSEEFKQTDNTFERYEKQSESSLREKVVDDDLLRAASAAVARSTVSEPTSTDAWWIDPNHDKAERQHNSLYSEFRPLGLEIFANRYTNPYYQYMNDNDRPVTNYIFSDAAPSKTSISDMTGAPISRDQPTVFEPANSMLYQHNLTPQGHTTESTGFSNTAPYIQFEQGQTINLNVSDGKNEPLNVVNFAPIQVLPPLEKGIFKKFPAIEAETYDPSTMQDSASGYTDYASKSDHDLPEDDRSSGGVLCPFPQRLHDMLSQNKFPEIFSWAPHGRAFIVRNPREFERKVLPLYFKQTKYRSFQRQLNLYGFRRIVHSEADRGGYYHEMFLRGRRKLSARIRRQGTHQYKRYQEQQEQQHAANVAIGLCAGKVLDNMAPFQRFGSMSEPNFYRMQPIDNQVVITSQSAGEDGYMSVSPKVSSYTSSPVPLSTTTTLHPENTMPESEMSGQDFCESHNPGVKLQHSTHNWQISPGCHCICECEGIVSEHRDYG